MTYTATILHIEALIPSVYQVFLGVESSWVDACEAGQYLELHMDEKKYPFSIANFCKGKNIVELHIGVSRSKTCNAFKIVTFLQNQPTVKIKIPLGRCCYKPSAQHLLLAASGTGFSQMKAIAERAIAYGENKQIDLFWACRSVDDFYLLETLHFFTQEFPSFYYYLVFPDRSQKALAELPSPSNLLFKAIATQCSNLVAADCYIAGSPKMVADTFDLLQQLGLDRENTHSDVLDYIPQPLLVEA